MIASVTQLRFHVRVFALALRSRQIVPSADLVGDRPFVDLPDWRGGQRRHRDQHVGPGVRGHPALVKVSVHLCKRHSRSGENNYSANLFT
jgi:hypothetical protein